MANNKLIDFVNLKKNEVKNPNFYYPHPEEPDRADNSDEKKAIKEAKIYERNVLDNTFDFHNFSHLIIEEMNKLDNIKAVVYGRRETGNMNLPFKTIILVLADRKIHYFEQNKTNYVYGTIGILITSARAAAKPYNYESFELTDNMKLWGIPHRDPWRVRITIGENFLNILGVDSSLLNVWNSEIQKETSVKKEKKAPPLKKDKTSKINVGKKTSADSDKLVKIEKLHKLYKDGALTKEEFEKEKRKILNNKRSSN
jgi:hypothetical protein